jgi:hypothetical protein
VDEPQGQRRLHVELSLAGENIPAWLDTGNPGQLEISSRVWGKIASQIEGGEPRKSTVQYWQFGTVECEKIQVRHLMLGNLERKNVEVVVLPDGKPFYNTYALIGMGFFKKDVIVLDFYRHLLWVKQR